MDPAQMLAVEIAALLKKPWEPIFIRDFAERGDLDR
jgi:DNA-binding XRE family transcriptional regulator